MNDALFDLPDGARLTPEPLDTLSAGRRLTLRQQHYLDRGFHPLGGRLHAEAAPHGDKTMPGRRCGNCWYRERVETNGNRRWPKCLAEVPPSFFMVGRPYIDRLSRSAASDCRAWWPACTLHSYGDPRLSPDAARHVPEEAG